MSKYCPHCGGEISAETTFCALCGAKISSTALVSSADPTPIAAATPANYVGTGYFFGMMLLYAIPVLGWIICIITAFSAKNKTKKSFAKALLIWLIISLIISAFLAVSAVWVSGMIVDYINETYGGEISDLKDLFTQLTELEQLKNIDLTQLQQLQDSGLVPGQ